MAEPTSETETKLQVLSPTGSHQFHTPAKCINEGPDVTFFLTSRAYTTIMTWLLQLNGAMFPRKSGDGPPQSWTVGATSLSLQTTLLVKLLGDLDVLVDDTPPEPGPRRFGNVAFRKWFKVVEDTLDSSLDEALPDAFKNFPEPEARGELKAYFLGSFGSSERLDYGSGHELSFLAFLGAVWKLGGFAESKDGSEERNIVLGVVERYLELIRKLIKTYNLEPAGSHGVWGLDDHSFIPYIFGSAQFAPPISAVAQIPPEGSLSSAPSPLDVTKEATVAQQRITNMYFGAIGFIYDVKRGPFWEHSPMLFDISGVKGGWAKINKGMLKMYNAEVLSKFPVVQHFPFGYIYPWEKDPAARQVSATAHVASQPQKAASSRSSANAEASASRPQATRAPPVLNPAPSGFVGTAAPWARNASAQDPTAGRPGMSPPTAAPWAQQPRAAGPTGSSGGDATRAPWAKK